jgi:hypothetical protein
MLDMGFELQICRIVEQYKMPGSSAGRQTMMFSPERVGNLGLATSFFNDESRKLVVNNRGSYGGGGGGCRGGGRWVRHGAPLERIERFKYLRCCT